MSKLRVSALSILLILILATVVGCTKTAPFKITNGTSVDLYVVIVGTTTSHTSGEGVKPECEIEPGQTCNPKHWIDNYNTYLIEARDAQGNVVYSKLFSNQELRDMNWEVVITQSQ
jgi:hypothetical protein